MHMKKNNHNYQDFAIYQLFSFESMSTFPHNIEKSQFSDTGDLKVKNIR